jgi:hypothetical protein
MNKQLSFEPDSLSGAVLGSLRRLTNAASALSPSHCLSMAESHLAAAVQEARTRPSVNVRLAQAIYDCCKELVTNFETLPIHSRPWIKGAILYFAETTDGEPDFESFLGFEDDCEVLNACLQLANREDLIINPEDYD